MTQVNTNQELGYYLNMPRGGENRDCVPTEQLNHGMIPFSHISFLHWKIWRIIRTGISSVDFSSEEKITCESYKLLVSSPFSFVTHDERFAEGEKKSAKSD